MSATVNLVFPHQLFEKNPLFESSNPFLLIEEHLFFRQYGFHKQKLVFHRASMKFYAKYLESLGKEVRYVEAFSEAGDIRQLMPLLASEGVKEIHYVDPVDDWLESRLKSGALEHAITIRRHDSPGFLNNREELSLFFKPGKRSFFQTEFYIGQRKKRGILVDSSNNPVGGKWSFDAENRLKYPKNRPQPRINYPESTPFYTEALAYITSHFGENPGEVTTNPLYPTDFTDSKKWLREFLQTRFQDFGPYEDAIVTGASILHHSVLTPMLNAGLLTPGDVLAETLAFAQESKVPMNSLEGFVRQIMGWREFIAGMYRFRGRVERTRNFWGFTRKIPVSFYDGTTGILPVDDTISKVLETGYCHHIERLMVLGNFMLLCEFDPDEVYRWFMELFIDSYDWVMVPNVYGMSQFADGGMMSTKPYISGSNYLMKMSDNPKGDWQPVWDGLFWRFMHTHRDFFLQNPRLGMLVRSFDKMPENKRLGHLETAEAYLASL